MFSGVGVSELLWLAVSEEAGTSLELIEEAEDGAGSLEGREEGCEAQLANKIAMVKSENGFILENYRADRTIVQMSSHRRTQSKRRFGIVVRIAFWIEIDATGALFYEKEGVPY